MESSDRDPRNGSGAWKYMPQPTLPNLPLPPPHYHHSYHRQSGDEDEDMPMPPPPPLDEDDELSVSAKPTIPLVDPNFLEALKKEPCTRTQSDVQLIYFTLRTFECLSRCEDETILGIAKTCTYSQRSANDILYCRGELAFNWFILLSGSVFIDGAMFFPTTCFGRRGTTTSHGDGATGLQTRRPNECLILEPSEMISVDYVDNAVSSSSVNAMGQELLQGHHQSPSTTSMTSSSLSHGYMTGNRNSHSSDTSSAYSGSDTMCSMPGSDDMDLSGLVESTVDSDEEDDLGGNIIVRDRVRECLEKDPSERNENDIQVLLEFTQHLSAFNDLTNTVRKALCQSMVFAVVEKGGTIVLNHGEELDSWSVVVHGSVSVVHDGVEVILSSGDSFGFGGDKPTLDKQYFQGEMKTMVDDCQFVCVTQEDYYRILKQGEDNQTRHYKNNSVVLITECKNTGRYSGDIIIRGTIEELMNQLVNMENPAIDPTYVEDFLLTQRVFMNPIDLTHLLLVWFNSVILKDKVTRIVLLWVNNHFVDFETNPELMSFLQRFQGLLENGIDNMNGQLRLLQIACSAKSRPRTIILTRPSRDDILPFHIMGGADNGYSIFISHVEMGSKAEELGLRVGDEIISVNGVPFFNINQSAAYDMLKESTHLVIIVKCNFLGYHECVHSSIPLIQPNSNTNRTVSSVATLQAQKNSMRNMSKKERFLKTIMKINIFPPRPTQDNNISKSHDCVDMYERGSSVIDSNECKIIDFPENVLKIYRSDQTFKYLLVNKETSAREVVMLALQEFVDLANCNSRDYGLFQISVTSGIIKSRRLQENLDSLAERIPLGSRYYIKRLDSNEQLVPDELIGEISKESEVHLLNLNPVELALQLTLEDYSIFRQIEATEYVNDLFDLKPAKPNLDKFSEIVNRETFWVVTEITQELICSKRVQMIKRFIKVATQCRECRNFNSMFAIISGLGHCAVTRLRNTWDKLPNKYQRLFSEMQELMDPSRNMGKYRNLLSSSFGQTPMIPFYPVVRKDLTFIDLGNSTYMDGLVNFEKMRMVAKEIRQLVQMSAAPFDTSSQPTMAAMNQLTTTGSNNLQQLTTTTGKRRKNLNKTHGLPNPKKMFEEMNMIRKVKAYLSKLQVNLDENSLHNMSLLCEPSVTETVKLKPPSGPPPSSVHPRRHPSPTLSTSSSASSESRRKFGTSHESYQKLLSLSEPKTKIHHVVKPASPNVSRKLSQHDRTNSESSSTTSGRLLLSVESSSVLPGK